MLRTARRPARGLSIVEMMVGIAVGLFIVAAASTLLVSQLGDNRRLLLETQIQQDLRAAMDIVVRDLRRSQFTLNAHEMVARSDTPTVRQNLFGVPTISGAAGARQVTYQYRRDDGVLDFGFRVQNGTLQALNGLGAWQDLTDRSVLRVTSFDIDADRAAAAAAANADAQVLPCPKLCADGTSNCWPRMRVVQLVVSITAEAVADPAFVRNVTAGVRVRNDRIDVAGVAGGASFSCPE
jgi:type IV pilus assembly protein PilW